MSRIEELSTLVKNQTTLVDNLESLIEKERLLKTRYANELFEATKAIEAQERKPREFKVGLDENGKPIGVGDTSFGAIMLIPNEKLPRTFIDVIEKLPVKITMDLAKRFNRDMTQYIGGYKYSQEEIAEVARFFGLQAEPSND